MRPWEMTTSGSLPPSIGQSFTADSVSLPSFTSAGGAEHGYHIAPVSAGPSVSAGTSMNRIPAACTSVAAKQSEIAKRNFTACIGGLLAVRRVGKGGHDVDPFAPCAFRRAHA